MAGSTAHLHSELSKAVGRRLVGIARILFEYDGLIEDNDGPLELRFADEHVLLLDGAGDGETLRAQTVAWVDPFQEPLTEENLKFIAESGRWRRMDCSQAERFSDLVGCLLEAVQLLENEFGRPAGVALKINGHHLWFTVGGDETTVHWVQPLGFRRTDAVRR